MSRIRPRVERRFVFIVLACSAIAGLPACGSAASSGSPTYFVRSATVAGLGRVLVDGAGFTLYVYEPDDQGPSKCTGICAVEWPPLLLPGGVTRPKAAEGASPALLGTTRRADGSLQVTYNRWPLYLYREDYRPGQATGQAEDMGAWYVLAVNGTVDRNPLPAVSRS